MRILAVSTWYPTPGAPFLGTFVRKDVQMLARDHDVTVLHLVPPATASSAPLREMDGGVEVIRVPLDLKRPGQHLAARRAVRERLADVDLLHTMAFSTLLPLVGLKPPVPWVHTEHWSALSVPDSFGRWWPRLMPLAGRALRGPDVVVPVCEFLARPIRRLRSGEVAVVPCLVDQPATPTPRPPRRDRVSLVSVGALVERKDPLVAIQTVAELDRRGLEADLTWVGEGPLRQALTDCAASLGLGGRLTVTGPLEPEGVVERLAACDLFLLPTLAENFCVSAAEALRAGRPVVVGATGGQAEYIDDSVGEVVAVQTAAAYADAIERVWAATVDATADDIAQRMQGPYSVEAIAEGYRSVYRLATDQAEKRIG